MKKIPKEVFEFDEGDKKFFLNLQKQPGIEKTLVIIKEMISDNLADPSFNLQKVFEQAGNKGDISYKDIISLRKAKFEKVLEKYKLERLNNNDLITYDLVNRLESIISKFSHILNGLTTIDTQEDVEYRRNINVLAHNFLKSIENMDPPIIFLNGIFINNDQYKELEDAFKQSFNVATLPKVREKINALGLAQVAKNQVSFPWKHIIERLYTLTRRKRPQTQLQRNLPIGYDLDINRYINMEVSIGFFLNNIQNFTSADVYVGQDLAGHFFNSFGTILTFTIGKSDGGFVNLTVELPTGMEIPRKGTVKGIQIIDITETGVIQGKIV